MSAEQSEIAETAGLWAIRVRDPDFRDWDGFTHWLEQDPEHLAAYEQALATDDWAGELFATPAEPITRPAPRPRRNWFIAGGAVAAALALVGSWAIFDRDAPARDIMTAAGEHRTIDLDDGSRVILNGGTRISFDPDTPRQVELAQGEAMFEVRHDAAKPFTVVTGQTRLLDAGTRFNVVRDGGAVDVAVAEGAVIYQPGPGQIRLNPGDALSLARPGAQPVLRKTALQAVGAWQSGQLQYDDASLDRVAHDLSRNLGRQIDVEGGAERMRFTGTLVLRGSPDQVLARAGPLLGVSFEARGQSWTMKPADGAHP